MARRCDRVLSAGMSPWRNHLRAALVRAAFALGRLWPVRTEVVLATGHADAISGNLVWIRDALGRLRADMKIVVLADRPRPGWSGILPGAIAAARAGWHLATARLFVVDDYFFPMYVIRPRRGTTFVQVWHACGAFKKFGYSVAERGFGADEAALQAYPIHTNYDLCLVSALRFAPFYAEAFRQPIERFVADLGIPRTDLFFDEGRRAAAAAAIRERYGIPTGRQVVLYAPTFRGARTTEARSPRPCARRPTRRPQRRPPPRPRRRPRRRPPRALGASSSTSRTGPRSTS